MFLYYPFNFCRTSNDATYSLTFCFILQYSWLTNNVIVSGEQWRGSAIQTHVSILPQTPLPSGQCYLFLIVVILSFFFLISLTRDLSMLLILSKNQLLVWLVFFIGFLFYVSLITALIFINSLLLFVSILICFSYNLSKCKLRSLIWDHSFPIQTFIAIKSLPNYYCFSGISQILICCVFISCKVFSNFPFYFLFDRWVI